MLSGSSVASAGKSTTLDAATELSTRRSSTRTRVNGTSSAMLYATPFTVSTIEEKSGASCNATNDPRPPGPVRSRPQLSRDANNARARTAPRRKGWSRVDIA